MDAEGFVYLKHMVRDRMDPLEVCDMIFQLVRLYDPVMVVTEKGAYAQGIMPVVERKMLEDDLFFRVETLNPATDKLHRSQAIRLRARAGKVKVDKNLDWWPSMEDELMIFPRGKNDDQVDTFSLVGLAINKFYEAPTQQELQDEQREEDKEEAGLYEIGRSELTGY
jgi:predicted phage terminase large subunit-like protein